MKVIDYSKDVEADISRSIEKALTKSAMVIEADAVFLCPVDTGQLKNSINYKVEGSIATVGTNLHYAAHVEYGTKRSKPHPFLRPAGDYNKGLIEKIFAKELKL